MPLAIGIGIAPELGHRFGAGSSVSRASQLRGMMAGDSLGQRGGTILGIGAKYLTGQVLATAASTATASGTLTIDGRTYAVTNGDSCTTISNTINADASATVVASVGDGTGGSFIGGLVLTSKTWGTNIVFTAGTVTGLNMPSAPTYLAANTFDGSQAAANPNPVSFLWPYEYTTLVGGVAWGGGAWLSNISKGKYRLDWQINRAVGGSNSGQEAAYSAISDRLKQMVSVILAEQAAGRSVNFVINYMSTNDAATGANIPIVQAFNDMVFVAQTILALPTNPDGTTIKFVQRTATPRGNSQNTGNRLVTSGGTGDTGATPATVTFTGNTVNFTGQPFSNGDICFFSTTGSLPSPLVAGSTSIYYVVNAASNSFQLAATAGGTVITLSGGSGTQTAHNGVANKLAIARGIRDKLIADFVTSVGVAGRVAVVNAWLHEATPGTVGSVTYIDGDITAGYCYDELHPAPFFNAELAALDLVALDTLFSTTTVTSRLPVSTSDTNNALTTKGAMQGTSGTVTCAGNATTNGNGATPFTINGHNSGTTSDSNVPTGWDVGTVAGWNATTPKNVAGTVTVTQEAAAAGNSIGNAIKIVAAIQNNGASTSTNSRFLDATCTFADADLTAAGISAGDQFEALACIELSGIGALTLGDGFRGVTLEMRVTDPDSTVRIVDSLQPPPNGTAIMGWDPSRSYTGSGAMIAQSGTWTRKTGTTTGTIAVRFSVGVAADVSFTAKVSQVMLRKAA